jgi:hypothetical protein
VDSQLIQWLPRFLAQEALVQVTNAEGMNGLLSKVVIDKSDSLSSGENRKPDEILEVPLKIYVSEGTKPNRWSDTDEFGKFAEKYGRTEGCFGNGDKSGLTLETPFGDDSALIRLLPVKNPLLGNGLQVTIQFPFLAAFEEIAKRSALLNVSEADRWTDVPQLGCWQPDNINGSKKRIGLAHRSFIPNALYSPGIATNFALWSIARVRWARQEFWPELKDKSMGEVLEKRMLLAGKVTSDKRASRR